MVEQHKTSQDLTPTIRLWDGKTYPTADVEHRSKPLADAARSASFFEERHDQQPTTYVPPSGPERALAQTCQALVIALTIVGVLVGLFGIGFLFGSAMPGWGGFVSFIKFGICLAILGVLGRFFVARPGPLQRTIRLKVEDGKACYFTPQMEVTADLKDLSWRIVTKTSRISQSYRFPTWLVNRQVIQVTGPDGYGGVFDFEVGHDDRSFEIWKAFLALAEVPRRDAEMPWRTLEEYATTKAFARPYWEQVANVLAVLFIWRMILSTVMLYLGDGAAAGLLVIAYPIATAGLCLWASNRVTVIRPIRPLREHVVYLRRMCVVGAVLVAIQFIQVAVPFNLIAIIPTLLAAPFVGLLLTKCLIYWESQLLEDGAPIGPRAGAAQRRAAQRAEAARSEVVKSPPKTPEPAIDEETPSEKRSREREPRSTEKEPAKLSRREQRKLRERGEESGSTLRKRSGMK